MIRFAPLCFLPHDHVDGKCPLDPVRGPISFARAQGLTIDRAEALWTAGRRLGAGAVAGWTNDVHIAAKGAGSVVFFSLQRQAAVAIDEGGKVFVVKLAGAPLVMEIGVVRDGIFQDRDWGQLPSELATSGERVSQNCD